MLRLAEGGVFAGETGEFADLDGVGRVRGEEEEGRGGDGGEVAKAREGFHEGGRDGEEGEERTRTRTRTKNEND